MRQSAARPGGRELEIDSSRTPVLVDARTWRVVPGRLPAAPRLRIGGVTLRGLGSGHVHAYDRTGRLLWSRADRNWWSVVAGSLVSARRSDAGYIDPRTGRRIRSLDRAEIAVLRECADVAPERPSTTAGPTICGR